VSRKELCDVVGLEHVVMAISNFERGNRSIEECRPQFEVQASAEVLDGMVRATATIGVLAVSEDGEGYAVKAIVAHELFYSIDSGSGWSKPELQRFADTTAVFNVWPYWRQHLHTMFGAMGLNVPLLPSYVLSPALVSASSGS
jgi:hypothetical protein